MSRKQVSRIAAACALVLAGAVHAETSIQFFGNLDIGVMTQNHAAGGSCTNAAGCNVTAIQDGQMAPSVFGFKGSEDLGGGMKAGFELEGGLVSATGQNGLVSNNGNLFGRQSFVSLSGDFGTFKFGEQYDPALYAAAEVDPRGLTDSFSSLGAWVSAYATGLVTGNAAGASYNPAGSNGGTILNGVFDTNAITYKYSNSGFNAMLGYSAAGIAGSTSAGAIKSLGLWYAADGLIVSGGWSQINDKSGNTAVQTEVLGAGYAVGPVAIRASWTNFKDYVAAAPGTAFADTTVIGIGADYKMDQHKFNVSVYDAKNSVTSGDETKWIALMDNYSLSKRTTLFAQLALVDAGINSTAITTSAAGLYVPGNGFGSGLAGYKTSYLGMGINHKF